MQKGYGVNKMKFKSKTELAQHMAELVRKGYLKQDWKEVHDNDGYIKKMVRTYIINFDMVKKKK